MKGKLFVVSGPSGVGKNTILNRIMEQNPRVRYSVSATSRQIRPGEVDGKNYYFVSRAQFEKMIADNELLEYAEYVGNYYGTPLSPIRDALENGIDVVMDVEVIGAKKIKQRLPSSVLVFVTVSDMDTVRRRLIGRGDVAPDAMEQRIERAKWECAQAADTYDYVVLNDDIDTAVAELSAIMAAEKCKTVDRVHLLKEET